MGKQRIKIVVLCYFYNCCGCCQVWIFLLVVMIGHQKLMAITSTLRVMLNSDVIIMKHSLNNGTITEWASLLYRDRRNRWTKGGEREIEWRVSDKYDAIVPNRDGPIIEMYVKKNQSFSLDTWFNKDTMIINHHNMSTVDLTDYIRPSILTSRISISILLWISIVEGVRMD